MLKVLAEGFILTPTAYLLSKWNWLDGAVVMFATVDVVSKVLNVQSTIASTCRLLRILRPLRLLKMIPGMNIVLVAVKAVVPAVLGISLCMLLAFTSFGIVGVSFFGGRLFRCAEDVSLARQDCVAAGFSWTNQDFSFDNIFEAWQSLFFVWTGDDSLSLCVSLSLSRSLSLSLARSLARSRARANSLCLSMSLADR